ncbi:NACHT domain-containing protein [Streptomyces albipurpureus]|uniref:NACHT domain-containing protein n=1 Tax=Streptomyces albipurpureus TaxID=2897419 RepID=A0ABT0UZQ1_9ACTN|nr:serine protease [Streptomyces sp. CWNU-1]MCM2394057.1 NACHT domain-containing protein [Streptomyces sp. CWNU-1]
MKSSSVARVVAVHGQQQGSGVLLGPRTILTCAHVVGSDQVAVAHPTREGRVSCTTLWTGDRHLIDAAILIADRDIIPADQLGRLRWARLTRDDALEGCQTIGFPGQQRHRRNHLDFGQYTGRVLPVAGRLRGALTFWLDHSPGLPDERSPLAGLSGAPLFAGSVLLGIVSKVRGTAGHQHLEAVPAEAIQQTLRRTSLTELFSTRGTGPVTPGDGASVPAVWWPTPAEKSLAAALALPPLERLTSFHSRDSAFEEGYADALRAQYRKTEVFGIDELGISEASWDLDTAYLSLEATEVESAEEPRPGSPIDTLSPARPQRVENLLSRHRHTLLRGEAGAGKTTLVWWLAAHAAGGTLPTELDELNGLVPFVIPMRSLQARGGGFPTLDELAQVAELPIGQAPHGWVERVLESGRALILVDGLDELPQAQRHRARSWLTLLLARHDNSRCLATVRPGAVEARWLTSEGFADLLLLPMSDEDIDAFVIAWHQAACLEYTPLDRMRADVEAGRLHELRQRLRREFANNRVLRDLARTPLLCAVICALHRKRKGTLPHTRWELYKATLDMLLGKRDSGRGIEAPEGLTIGVEENKLLLQHIAVWLVRNGQTQLTLEKAVTQIELATRSMRHVRDQGSPERILTHLLNRSGLLQQRTGDVIQFIHRTFQDYLAAKEFSDTDSVSELLRHAHDEQWQDVIRLAVGHLDRSRVDELVRGLIERGDRAADESDRRSLHLLAGYCASSAVFLNHHILAASEQRIRALMPPENFQQVHALASLGAYVLPLLPGPARNPAISKAVIETIAAVGEEAGLDRLLEFTQDPHPQVRHALVDAWSSLPAETYARRVLSRTDLADITLTVTTKEQLQALEHCGPCTDVFVRGPHSAADLETCLPRTGLTRLDVVSNSAVADLSFVRSRAPIDRLTLLGCSQLSDLGELAERSFTDVGLGGGELALPGPYPRIGLLYVYEESAMDYAALAQWNTVEGLSLQPPQRMSSLVRAIEGMTALRRLTIFQLELLDLDAADTAPRITSLTLSALDRHLNTSALARVFPALNRLMLSVHGVREYAIDLTPLQQLPGLTIGITANGVRLQITGAEPFEGRLKVVTGQ